MSQSLLHQGKRSNLLHSVVVYDYAYGLNPFFIRASARTYHLVSTAFRATSQSLLHQGKRSNQHHGGCVHCQHGVSIPSSSGQALELRFALRRHGVGFGLNPFFIRASARTAHMARMFAAKAGLNPFFIRASARTQRPFVAAVRTPGSQSLLHQGKRSNAAQHAGRACERVSIPSSSGQALELRELGDEPPRLVGLNPFFIRASARTSTIASCCGMRTSQSLLHQGKRSNYTEMAVFI